MSTSSRRIITILVLVLMLGAIWWVAGTHTELSKKMDEFSASAADRWSKIEMAMSSDEPTDEPAAIQETTLAE